MSTMTALRLALAGGLTDRIRMALTIACSALASIALLSAAIVASIVGGLPGDETLAPYSNAVLNQAGLRPGVVFTLVVLCVPILFLVGQVARFGSPARDRRFAALRMAGATPGQVSFVVSLETLFATLVGSSGGLALVLIGQVVLDAPDSNGIRSLPTDVGPPLWGVLAVLLALPMVSVGLSIVALRRVRLTAFGVLHRRRLRPPRITLALLMLGATAGLLVLAPLRREIDENDSALFVAAMSLIVVLLIAVSLVLGAASMSAVIGVQAARRAQRADWLIAGRRLIEDPFAASRALGALFVCVFIAVGVAGVRDWLLSSVELTQEVNAMLNDQPADVGVDPDIAFHSGAFALIQLAMTVAVLIAATAVGVALLEQFVQRRRTLAALVAIGTPRRVLARAGMLQIALPLFPGVVVAAVAGWLGARSLFGWRVTETGGGFSTCRPPSSINTDAAMQAFCADPSNVTVVPSRSLTIVLGVPWESFALIGGGAVLGTLLLGALASVLLRVSTDVAELRAAA